MSFTYIKQNKKRFAIFTRYGTPNNENTNTPSPVNYRIKNANNGRCASFGKSNRGLHGNHIDEMGPGKYNAKTDIVIHKRPIFR